MLTSGTGWMISTRAISSAFHIWPWEYWLYVPIAGGLMAGGTYALTRSAR
jgi:hypothetical protein